MQPSGISKPALCAGFARFQGVVLSWVGVCIKHPKVGLVEGHLGPPRRALYDVLLIPSVVALRDGPSLRSRAAPVPRPPDGPKEAPPPSGPIERLNLDLSPVSPPGRPVGACVPPPTERCAFAPETARFQPRCHTFAIRLPYVCHTLAIRQIPNETSRNPRCAAKPPHPSRNLSLTTRDTRRRRQTTSGRSLRSPRSLTLRPCVPR